MTDITFHFNVPDRLVYACRLLRKAVRQGAQVVVSAPSGVLALFDRQLWTFETLEFVPHVYLQQGQTTPPHLQATPVWLVDQVSDAPHRQVLLNLGVEVPTSFEQFSRLIEIVPTDPPSRDLARARWKHYTQGAHPITRHDVATETSP
jgi:DNA polymerase III subunit chi